MQGIWYCCLIKFIKRYTQNIWQCCPGIANL